MSRFNRVRPFIGRSGQPALLLLGLLAVCVWPVAVAGQAPIPPSPTESLSFGTDWTEQIPAHVAIVDGEASLEREGRVDDLSENVPLLTGDRIRTIRGRVEVLFADGSVLDVDQFSSVDMLSDTLMRLGEGRVHLTIARTGSSITYRVDAAGTTAWIYAQGEYRLAVAPRATDPDVRLKVIRGAAELGTSRGRTLLRAGDEARASADVEPSLPYAVTAASRDAFDRWTEARRRDRVGAVSAQYLPEELRYYGGTFDRDGDWRYDRAYGYVWYPRVDVGWQPYYDGSWSFYGSFGWTWIGGGGGWAWPTHHYGRWGVASSGWYWIPGRHWGPAWVSWASAPGYVSWCPLGYNNRPVFATTNIYYASDRYGWTVMPSRSLRPGVAVPRYAVTRLQHGGSAPGFVQHAAPPTRPDGWQSTARPLTGPGAGSRVPGTRSSVRVANAPTGRTSETSAPSARRAIETVPRRSAPLDTAVSGPRTAPRAQSARTYREDAASSPEVREVAPARTAGSAYSRVPARRTEAPPDAAPTRSTDERPASGRRPSSPAPSSDRSRAEPSRDRSHAATTPSTTRSLPASGGTPRVEPGRRPAENGSRPSPRAAGGSSPTGGAGSPRGTAQPRQAR